MVSKASDTVRLACSYDAGLYFRCDRGLPWHPDNLIAAAVGHPRTDGGMGVGPSAGRDVGFGRVPAADVPRALRELRELDFAVRVRLFRRGEGGRPEELPLPAAGGE